MQFPRLLVSAVNVCVSYSVYSDVEPFYAFFRGIITRQVRMQSCTKSARGPKCAVVLTPLFVPGLVGQFINTPLPAGAVESACLAFVN